MNPTQIPFPSPFTFIGAQALPPGGAQHQSQPVPGGPVGAAPMIMMPQFQQQQAGFQVPNFLLQAFQQQNTPQWILPQSQTPPLAAPPPAQGYMPLQRPSVSAQKQYSRQKNETSSQDDGSAPIGSDPDDEEMLIKTLQKAKAKGITPCKALDKLDQVYNHTALEWKDFFLENLERLIPKIYRPAHGPHTYGSAPPISRPRSSPSTAVKTVKHNPVKPVKSRPSAHGPGQTSTARHVTKGLSTTPTRVKKTLQPLGRASAPTLTSSATTRTRRGAPVHEFHAGAFIPPSFGLVAPDPPQRDGSQDASKFTEEDKVFFILFLQWRLRQPGTIPSKQDLYAALGEQTPHHNAEAWKRHWAEHPELPDKIYIEARKRSEAEHLSLEPGPPGYARLADSGDEEPQEDEAAEEVADNASVVSYYDPPEDTPKARSADKTPAPSKYVKSASKTLRYPITEDDLRAMAKYKFEKRHEWDQHDTKQGPWREFADRPENHTRTLGSWYLVSRDRAEELDGFYKQYLAEAEDRIAKSTPPRQDSGEAQARPFAVTVKTEKAMQSPASNAERPQKRGFERESVSPHKRAKQDVADMREYIEISDSSD